MAGAAGDGWKMLTSNLHNFWQIIHNYSVEEIEPPFS